MSNHIKTNKNKRMNNIRKMPLADVKDYFSRNKEEINLEDEDGVTPLLAAIASNRLELVRALIELGASPNYTSSKATLPLIFAIDSAIQTDDYSSDEDAAITVDIIKFLLDNGASPIIVDVVEGENAYDYCVHNFSDVEYLFHR
jgi:ankyrin repeat protein